MGLPHVTYTEHEAKFAVPQTYAGVSAEHESLRSLFGSGELGKDDASHKALDHDPGDGLDAHDEDCLRTFVCRGPRTVACIKESTVLAF